MKINDVLLIKGHKITLPKNWRKGKVEDLIVSKDNDIHGAVLSVYNKRKDTRSFLLKRPVETLIPFEIMSCTKEDNEYFQTLSVIVEKEKWQ